MRGLVIIGLVASLAGCTDDLDYEVVVGELYLDGDGAPSVTRSMARRSLGSSARQAVACRNAAPTRVDMPA